MDYELASRLAQDFGSYIPGTRMPYDLTPGEKRILGPSPRGNPNDQGIAKSIAFSLANTDSETVPKPKTAEPPKRMHFPRGFDLFDLDF